MSSGGSAFMARQLSSPWQRDRGFESPSLQQRVGCEPDSFALDCRRAHGCPTHSPFRPLLHENGDLRVGEHFDGLAAEDNRRDTATPV